MMASRGFTLRTLGGFALEYEARTCELVYEKSRALVAFLAMEPGRKFSRAYLADLLWPELEREAALTNLRQVLHDMRKAFQSAGVDQSPLCVDRESAGLDVAFGSCVDAIDLTFDSRICPETPLALHCCLCTEQMERVAAGYLGEFLKDLALHDCQEFDDWLQVQREALRLRVLTVLNRLADCHELMGSVARALSASTRYLDLDPWSDDGLRRAMRLYALNGQSDVALGRYRAACLVLDREAGIALSEETQALAARIEAGKLGRMGEDGRDEHTVALAAIPQSVPERRYVTVLFCELCPIGVDDPEEALAMLGPPQAACTELIRQHGGFLVQTHGGGLLAYFGVPKATENAALQAARAALALARSRFVEIDLRVGVHSGFIIVNEQRMPDAIGTISAMAIRLRQIVEAGEVAVSDATRLLLDGYFDCTDLGVRALRGIARPIRVFRIDGASAARTRLDARGVLTPLVGRGPELAELCALWHEALRGGGRVVLLRGEAGIGKSRLVEALADVVRTQGRAVHSLRCFPEHSPSPFRPVLEHIEADFGFALGDTPEDKFVRLATRIEQTDGANARETVPLYAQLLSLTICPPYEPVAFFSQYLRERALGMLLEWIDTWAGREACVLIVEDLHWADPSTLELLTRFVQRGPRAPILAVLTARPGFCPPWDEGRTVPLELGVLDLEATVQLVSSIASWISPETLRGVAERADGVPLFAEELARDLVGEEQNPIPPTLLDLLAARLDGLGPAKAVAQSAAAVGREFDAELLRQIIPVDRNTIERLLGELVASGLVHRGDGGIYRFRHALIRDAAYSAQTHGEQEVMHRRIAIALRSLARDVRPELLAQHWAAGGDIQRAIESWVEAGKRASRESANHEALMHFEAGQKLVEQLPSSPERERLELDVYLGLGAAAAAVNGYASEEGLAYYERAMTICGLQKEEPVLFPAVWRLWASASSRAGYACANDLAQHLVRMAECSSDPLHGQQAHFALGATLFWQGRFVEARKQFDEVLRAYRPEHHAGHIVCFGEDVGVTAESYYSWVMWFLGFPEQSRAASRRALVTARRLGHAYSLGYALVFAALLRCRFSEPREATELACETLVLSRKHGFMLWEIGGLLAQGWGRAIAGEIGGIDMIRQCVESTRTAMRGVTLVVFLPLADALVTFGDFAHGVSVCDEALSIGDSLGDLHARAELLRLKGECLLGMSRANALKAEKLFREALALSCDQQARSLRLRAAISLARLQQVQGCIGDAQGELEEALDGYADGFVTADLGSARELLSSLRY